MKLKLSLTISSLLLTLCLFSQSADSTRLAILDGEYWWGGLSAQGFKMPYGVTTKMTIDLWGDNKGNQAQPLLLSSKGRYVWSEQPFRYSIAGGELTVAIRAGKLETGNAGKNLADAYRYAVKNFFKPNGKIPDKLLFTRPQFNTWIELQYDQNEKDILKYAQSILDNGYSPGVLMLDDTWQENYGVWDFAPRNFKEPKKMIEKLHAMGFKIMLWVCPFVSADSKEYRYLAQKKLLVLDAQKTQEVMWANTNNKPAIIHWWNGASACLDLSNPDARKWFKSKMDLLQKEYGVDGFKFDAGDAGFYTGGIVSFNATSPNNHTAFFAQMGLDYPLNEYRASWKMAGLPLAQRLSDKGHSWTDLQKLIPDLTTQSLMGYAYTCPDMIGGGQYTSFSKGAKIAEELIVRSAQVHALMPMMQFSVTPWRVLLKENALLCVAAANLHQTMSGLILELAENAAKTGEPIARPIEFVFPKMGYEFIKDQFMLGDNIVVAPMVLKGSYKRLLVLPPGKWKGDDGSIIKGGKTIEINVPIERIPFYIKQS